MLQLDTIKIKKVMALLVESKYWQKKVCLKSEKVKFEGEYKCALWRTR